MTDDAIRPDPVPLEDPKRGGGFSFVWLVPVVALAVALAAAWQNYSQRGPLITVSFGNAAGVSADETELRHRDITVGLVESVEFSDNLAEVEVGIRLDPDIAPFVDQDARFWVVRPQVTAQGVTGLDTVLSGVYIQGAWDGVEGTTAERFQGFDEAPLLRAGETGTRFRLLAEDGLPTGETPIIYKGVVVGRIAGAEIAPDGLSVSTEAVIRAPFDALISDETRFWDISGFSFSIGAEGAGIEFTSLASLIAGGITFETFGSGGAALSEDPTFELFPDSAAAREDFFLDGSGTTVDLLAVFDDNIAGLRAGAPVELGGLRVGEVVALSGLVDPLRFGDSDARLVTTLRISPARVGLGEDAGAAELLDFLDLRAEQGLRAQLTNASLLTGGLKVDLATLDDAGPSGIDRAADPFPELPTAPADVANIAATAQGLLARVDALPVEELLAAAIGFLEDSSGLIGAEETQALPAQFGALAGDLATSAGRLDALLAGLQDGGGAQSLAATLANLEATTADLPDLVARAGGLIDAIEALPLDDFVTRASALVETTESLLSDEATRALPGNLTATLGDLQDTLTAVTALAAAPETRDVPPAILALTTDLQGLAQRLDATLAETEAQGTVSALTAALRTLDEAAATVPGIAEDTRAALAQIRALPLADLGDRLAAVLQAVETLVGDEAVQALPASANATLADLRRTLTGVADLVEAEDTRAVAPAITALTGDLQAVTGQLDALLRTAETEGTIAALTDTLRGVDAAAGAVPPLAEDTRALLEQLRTLPLAELAERMQSLFTAAEELVRDPATQALPVDTRAAIADLRGLLASAQGIADDPALRGLPGEVSTLATDLQGAGRRLDGLLAQIEDEDTVARLTAAIDDVATAAETLPGLADQARGVLDEAAGLPLEDLATRATELVASAEALLNQDSTRALPGQLGTTLDSLRDTLDSLREGGAIDNANAALLAARDAAQAVAEASALLPDLSRRLSRAADQAGTTLAGFDRESAFNRDLQGAIRQIDAAAVSIERLARQLSRDPSSLITGR